jgi:hypothetical protein
VKLSDNVTAFLQERSSEVSRLFELEIESALQAEAIESPIEQIFLIEWNFQEIQSGDKFRFYLVPQVPVNYSSGKFILDFRIDFMSSAIGDFDLPALNEVPEPLLGIELDGHIWHEKTKKQVEYHKERERFFSSQGWTLLRFAGSEIVKNPGKCVSEVLELANKKRLQYRQDLTASSLQKK